MRDLDKICISVSIFCLIFFSYVFVQFFISAKQLNKSLMPEKKNLPLFFTITFPVLILFSDSIGKFWKRYRNPAYMNLHKKLITANIKLEPEIVFTAQIMLGICVGVFAFFAILFIFTNIYAGLIGFAIFGFSGYMYPRNLVDNIAEKRQHDIMRALPFAIDLLTSAMRSGLDFSASVRYYVHNESKNQPLAQEFSIVLRDIELGKTRIEALDAMAKKIGIKEFTSFVSSIIHGTEVGASITDTLKIQGTEMRRVRFNLAERKAARAPSLMILPIALFIMPAFFMVIAAPIFIKVQSTGGLGAILK